MNKFIWNEEENTIRGSFINIALTIFYACIIIASMIWTRIAQNVAEITSFLVGFYGISFSVWAGKKTIEMIRGAKEVIPGKYGDMISKIFEKTVITEKAEAKPEDKQ
jgi:hypothetical protein